MPIVDPATPVPGVPARLVGPNTVATCHSPAVVASGVALLARAVQARLGRREAVGRGVATDALPVAIPVAGRSRPAALVVRRPRTVKVVGAIGLLEAGPVVVVRDGTASPAGPSPGGPVLAACQAEVVRAVADVNATVHVLLLGRVPAGRGGPAVALLRGPLVPPKVLGPLPPVDGEARVVAPALHPYRPLHTAVEVPNVDAAPGHRPTASTAAVLPRQAPGRPARRAVAEAVDGDVVEEVAIAANAGVAASVGPGIRLVVVAALLPNEEDAPAAGETVTRPVLAPSLRAGRTPTGAHATSVAGRGGATGVAGPPFGDAAQDGPDATPTGLGRPARPDVPLLRVPVADVRLAAVVVVREGVPVPRPVACRAPPYRRADRDAIVTAGVHPPRRGPSGANATHRPFPITDVLVDVEAPTARTPNVGGVAD